MLRVDLFFRVKSHASLVCCPFDRRVIDALYYTSTTYKPHTLIDVATLTGFDPCPSKQSIFLIISLIEPWV
jgi:hypothetical protein